MPVRNLIFVAFVEPVAEGQVFPRTEWPLHITLLRFDVRFDAGSQESGDVAERIAGLADGAATAALGAPLTIGEEAGFGRNGSVPVNLVQPHAALQELHEQLVKLVPVVEGRILTPGHTLTGYRPHVSHQGTTGAGAKRLHPGDAVVLDRVALVDMAPGGNHTIRRVLRLWSREGGS
ncbi:2'-5' RNA ligase family protein [Pseudarthrobacter sp. NPDC058119]|uniref:2'-5' RNA ligase family protein n=1 Tax=Pseudarthrobacter sp. NPDC058119 TaxID=3346348 RepID=UPI0036DA63CF